MHTHTFHHLKPHLTTTAINITVQIEKESEIGLQAWEGSQRAMNHMLTN